MPLRALGVFLAPAAAAAAAVLDCGDLPRYALARSRDFFSLRMYSLWYIIDNGADAVSVDAAWDIARLQRYVEKQGLKLVAGLYTHGHFDHIGGSVPGSPASPLPGATELHRAKVPLFLGAGDIDAATLQTKLGADTWRPLKEGDTLSVLGDELPILVIDSPGHTIGGVTFWLRGTGPGVRAECAEGMLLTGDTLFLKNVGRTDLPGGDSTTLLRSLSRLSATPEGVQVLPGHSYDAPPRRSTMGTVRSDCGMMRSAVAKFPPASLPPLPSHRIQTSSEEL
ncbi:gloB [Symbiodinium natans]|uniref:GloB protein n=1 Tax=Symbiodinium natans TaxID=878477 RepID=A0A812GUC5_9DINO|nr:gloB [Symbiodinium natans]